MEIVKELNLNGNPQTVKNGSFINARNIRLSSDGTFITNDEGFTNALQFYTPTKPLKVKGVTQPLTEVTIQGNIVGYINCPNEIVIFTKNNNDSHIYRLVEYLDNSGLCVIEVNSAWTYNNGDICGTFIYNVENDLIISIAEYSNNGNTPLYVINLNKCSSTDDINSYTTAPNIPVTNLLCKEFVSGSIPVGTYYFFVRYKYNNKDYTNWIPVGKSYNAYALDNKTLINHTYNIGREDADTPAQNVFITSDINNNNISNFTFNFRIKYSDESTTYKRYSHIQLGYILQTDNAVVGRINNEYSIPKNVQINTIDFVFDTTNSKEIGIDELLLPISKLNNVKTITNFEQKLYVANFNETYYVDNYESLNTNVHQNHLIQVDLEVTETTNFIETANTRIEIYDKRKNLVATLTVPISTMKFTFVNYNDEEQEGETEAQTNSRLLVDYLFNNGVQRGLTNVTKAELKSSLIDVAIDFSNLEFITYDVSQGTGRYGWERGNDGKHYNFEVWSSVSGHINLGQDLINPINLYTDSNDDAFNIANEVKSLTPGGMYNFYIHYIHKDGSYTDGIKIEICDSNYNVLDIYPLDYNIDSSTQRPNIYQSDPKTLPNVYSICSHLIADSDTPAYRKYCFRVPIITKNKLYKISPKFTNIINPDANKYVGYFITYQELNNNFQLRIDSNFNNGLIIGKALDYQLGLISMSNAKLFCWANYNNNSLTGAYSGNNYYNITNIKAIRSSSKGSIGNINVDRDGIEGIVALLIENGENLDSLNSMICTISSDSVKDENNVPLRNFGYNALFTTGQNTYKEDSSNNIEFDSPSYLCYDTSIIFKDKTIYTTTDNKVWKKNTFTFKNDEDLYDDKYATYLHFPKYSNYNLNCISIKKEPEQISAVYDSNKRIINTIIDAKNLTDLFELKSFYFYNVYKSYRFYNVTNIYISKFVNMIRTSYPIRSESNDISWRKFNPNDYYILDNKFDEIINIFGVSKHFYIHTTTTLLVASSDATLVADNTNISLSGHKLFDLPPTALFTSDLGYGGLKHQKCQLFSNYGYIWYDTDHNKLFKIDGKQITDLSAGIDEILNKYNFEYCYINLDNNTNRIYFCFVNSNYKFTIAYSGLFDKYISIMDFVFDKGLHTTNKVYFTNNENLIYKYSNTDYGDYKELSYNTEICSPVEESVPYSSFDIIINISPETPKVLESIRWIHSYITQNIIDAGNLAELEDTYKMNTSTNYVKQPNEKAKELENAYISIYNNNINTGILSLFNSVLNRISIKNNAEEDNMIDSYKYPHYEKGVWQFNYFRDIINDSNARNSDIKSLIYGTYFIIRFIFKNPIINNVRFNKKLKFDSISTKINQY